MKQFFILLIFFLLLGPFLVLANSETQILPIFEEEYHKNSDMQADLIVDFGESAFFACLSCSPLMRSNPFAYAACLREAGFCLNEEDVVEEVCGEGRSFSVGECVSHDTACKEQFGAFSYYEDRKNSDGSFTCGCAEGYGWNNNRTQCVMSACPDNNIFYSPYRNNDGTVLYGRCISRDAACAGEYGEGSIFSGINSYGAYECACVSGYSWSGNGERCEEVIVKGIESKEFAATTGEADEQFDQELGKRLSGRILLQVEANGEAWYVNPDDLKRYYLGRPIDAFGIMRTIGLGARHSFIESHNIYPERLAGKILIDVEDLGKAYYVDAVERQAHYLGSPEEAFRVMRERGLGISNYDILKIGMGEI